MQNIITFGNNNLIFTEIEAKYELIEEENDSSEAEFRLIEKEKELNNDKNNYLNAGYKFLNKEYDLCKNKWESINKENDSNNEENKSIETKNKSVEKECVLIEDKYKLFEEENFWSKQKKNPAILKIAGFFRISSALLIISSNWTLPSLFIYFDT